MKVDDFKVIKFNGRDIKVYRCGKLKYPEFSYEGETSGKRIKRFNKERVISLVNSGYKGRYLGTVVRALGAGKQKVLLAHRAVAIAYIPNPDNLPQVHHINGNQQDNRVENLEWVSNHTNSQEYTNRRPQKGFRLHKTNIGLSYGARINIYATSYSLGYFKTKREAQQCYFDTYKEWWGIEPHLEPNLLS